MNSNTIPSAIEWLHLHHEDGEVSPQMLIEFAKLHVKLALQSASEKAKMSVFPYAQEEWEIVPDEITGDDINEEGSGCTDGFSIEINKSSILNAYPIELIN